MRRLATLAAAAVLALTSIAGTATAASTGDSGTGGGAGFTAEQAPPTAAQRSAMRYLKLLFPMKGEPKAKKAAKLAVAGSLAAQYVEFQEALFDAASGNNQPWQSTVLKLNGSGVDACSIAQGAAVPTCLNYATIRVKGKKLESFTVGGMTLAGRFAAPQTTPTVANGATLTPRAAYDNPRLTGLMVIFTVTSPADGERTVDVASSSYTHADGLEQSATAENAIAPSAPIPAGQSNTIALLFPGAKLGGTLKVPIATTGQEPTTEDAVLRIS